jgi:endoglucanase
MTLLEELEILVKAHGPSGREEEVRETIAEMLKPLVDEVYVDGLGNLIGVRRGAEELKIMLDAHMDEVGIVVKHIDDHGWIWFDRVGGIHEKALLGQRVTLLTDSGPVGGVVGLKGRHLLSDEEALKATAVKEMWIDIGAVTREEALEMGVRVGDLGTFEKRMYRLGELICAPSIDDRSGCLVLLEALRRLSDLDASVYAVFAVMEEVGCRGALTAAYGVEPDVAIIIDTTYGEDPATDVRETPIRIGHGPGVRALEMSRTWAPLGHTVPRRLLRLIEEAAEAEGIAYQREVVTFAATDAATLHLARAGIPTGEILVARRYSHSPIEVASLRDIEAAAHLVAASVKRLEAEWTPGIRRVK